MNIRGKMYHLKTFSREMGNTCFLMKLFDVEKKSVDFLTLICILNRL